MLFYDAVTGMDSKELKVLIEREFPELYNIIDCESKWDNTRCNEEFGCKAGKGFGQIIPTTHKYCETKLERSLNLDNPLDNLHCSLWLYVYEGVRHWEEWSGHCWKNYVY